MPTSGPIWQDLPRRPRWVKAVGWLCKKSMTVLETTKLGATRTWFFTLAFSIVITFWLVKFQGMTGLFALASVGVLWMAGIVVMALLRHKLWDRCCHFLESDQYQQDDPLGQVLGYYEVDYWLERHPYLLDTVAQWALANNRTLQNRHLWKIRAQEGHAPGKDYDFMLTITPDIMEHTDRIMKYPGPRDVANGALWRAMDRLELSQSSLLERDAQMREEKAPRRL